MIWVVGKKPERQIVEDSNEGLLSNPRTSLKRPVENEGKREYMRLGWKPLRGTKKDLITARSAALYHRFLLGKDHIRSLGKSGGRGTERETFGSLLHQMFRRDDKREGLAHECQEFGEGKRLGNMKLCVMNRA